MVLYIHKNTQEYNNNKNKIKKDFNQVNEVNDTACAYHAASLLMLGEENPLQWNKGSVWVSRHPVVNAVEGAPPIIKEDKQA